MGQLPTRCTKHQQQACAPFKKKENEATTRKRKISPTGWNLWLCFSLANKKLTVSQRLFVEPIRRVGLIWQLRASRNETKRLQNVLKSLEKNVARTTGRARLVCVPRTIFSCALCAIYYYIFCTPFFACVIIVHNVFLRALLLCTMFSCVRFSLLHTICNVALLVSWTLFRFVCVRAIYCLLHDIFACVIIVHNIFLRVLFSCAFLCPYVAHIYIANTHIL